ncbi:MAG: S49 family peptidase [bacterium]|nr:S49 family peptidase [bacterium]
MFRPLLMTAFLLVTLGGCAHRPLQTVMRGSMRMTGGMNMNMKGQLSTDFQTDNTASRLSSVTVYASDHCQSSRCVAVVDVDGLLFNKNISGIGSMGENPVALFREKLDTLAQNESVAAIVLRINSPGGGVTAADVMTRDMLELKNRRGIPVVACLMDVGAGGGYYLATAADHVVAHPTSLVGGIGVILNIYFLQDMSTFSVESKPVTAGDKINMATPERAMQPQERELLQSIADDFHQRFIQRVRASRAISPASEVEIFDGRVVTGEQSLALGLVDQIGYLDDAVAVARQLAQLPDNAPLVMLRRDNDRAYTLLDVTPNTPTMSSLISLKIPGLDRSQMPTFMYLWQPEPSMLSGM